MFWIVLDYFEGGNSMSYLGHKVSQVLLEADTVKELDDAYRVVNDCYSVLREQLKVIEKIRGG